jgi:hypothetical protein
MTWSLKEPFMRSARPASNRAREAEQFVAGLFEGAGWTVRPAPEGGDDHADLAVQRNGQRYAVQIKASQGRADRVVPLLSQAILQAQALAAQEGGADPMAMVYVDHASAALLSQVTAFTARYAPRVAFGIVAQEGPSHFHGPGLEDLQGPSPQGAGPHRRARQRLKPGQAVPVPVQGVNLFSDLNQWMLKVLLAPELPQGLLNAPRGRYCSGAELAAAANVSAMSASRFLGQLDREAFLDRSSPHLRLVRRQELFSRWSAAAMRPCAEIPARFLVRVPAALQIRELLGRAPGERCLGLFAAADELTLGHVSGVPPHVYVRKLPRAGLGASGDWEMLMAFPQEAPDLIVRQAPWPESTFRGAVDRGGLLAADAIQVWLDVSHHPSRGQEQARLIYQEVLQPLVSQGE